MQRALVILYGTAFRTYQDLDPLKCNDFWQNLASESHNDFFIFLKKQYNIEVDITYALNNKNSKEIFNKLNEYYSSNCSIIEQKEQLEHPLNFSHPWMRKHAKGFKYFLGAHCLFQCIQKYLANNIFKEKSRLSKYEFIFILRIDIFLKEYFWTNCFNPKSNTISYPFKHSTPYICDVFFFIPRRFFTSIQSLYLWHDCLQHLTKCGTEPEYFKSNLFYGLNERERENIIFNPDYVAPYINTWHMCSTYRKNIKMGFPNTYWNPLYINSRIQNFIFNKDQKEIIVDEFYKGNCLNYCKSFQKFAKESSYEERFESTKFTFNTATQISRVAHYNDLMNVKLSKSTIHIKNSIFYAKSRIDLYVAKKLIKNCLIHKIKFKENSINLCNFSVKRFLKSSKKINSL